MSRTHCPFLKILNDEIPTRSQLFLTSVVNFSKPFKSKPANGYEVVHSGIVLYIKNHLQTICKTGLNLNNDRSSGALVGALLTVVLSGVTTLVVLYYRCARTTIEDKIL